MRRSIRSAGPFTARPATIGLTATQGTRRERERVADRRARRGSARCSRRGCSARSRARRRRRAPRARPAPGARRRRRGIRLASTSSRWPRATNHSWNANEPAGVASQVRTGRRWPAAGGRRARPPGQPLRDGGERLARTERLRPHEVQPEVEVAEPEPVLAAPATPRSRACARSRRPGPSRAPRRAGRRARRARCRGRARRAGRAPRGRRRRCRHRQLAGLEHPRRDRGRSARRRRRRRGERPSQRRERGLRPRAGAQRRRAAGPRPCRRRRRGSGSPPRRRPLPGRARARGSAPRFPGRRAARTARRRQREGVRRAVGRLDEAEGARVADPAQDAQVGRHGARHVGVDDEHRPVERRRARPRPPRPDRRPDRRRSRLRARPRAAPPRRRPSPRSSAPPRRTPPTTSASIAQRDLGAQVLGQPALPVRAVGNDDRATGRRLASWPGPSTTRRSPSALDRLARCSTLAGTTSYAVRAYRRAAELVRAAPIAVAALVRAGRARELRGIGQSIEARLRELVDDRRRSRSSPSSSVGRLAA